MKKKKKNKTTKISIADYVKAVKRADREMQLEITPGWKASTRVHKSKKAYDRKRDKRVNLEE